MSKYSFRHSLLDRHRPGNVAMKIPTNQCPLTPSQCRSKRVLKHYFVRRNKWPAQDTRTMQYHNHWPQVLFVTIADQIVFQSLWLPHLCIHLLKDLKFNDKQIKSKWNFIIFFRSHTVNFQFENLISFVYWLVILRRMKFGFKWMLKLFISRYQNAPVNCTLSYSLCRNQVLSRSLCQSI